MGSPVPSLPPFSAEVSSATGGGLVVEGRGVVGGGGVVEGGSVSQLGAGACGHEGLNRWDSA